MHNQRTRIQSLVLIAAVFCMLVVAGCRNSSNAKPAAVAVKPRPAPAFIVTDPPGATKVATDMPSMDKHSAHGVTCEQCHETAAPTMAPTSNKACLGCHKQAELIKATQKYDDVKHKSQNPHDSHLHGASCLICHHNHSQSVLYCDECHKPKFGWKVP